MVLGFLNSSGQCAAPEVSLHSKLETNEDYIESQKEVEKALDWLCTNPLEVCISEREQLNSFVMVWMSGSPEYTLSFEPSCAPFLKADPDLLFPMIHGMSRELLKRPQQNKKQLYRAGYQTVWKLTESKPRKLKSAELKAFHKAMRRDNLDEYLQEYCPICK